MDLFDASVEWGKSSRIAFAERLFPPYTCSLCCHLFNLENFKREFFIEHGRLANTRMHIFFCAPPGYTKSLILQRLIQGKAAAYAESGVNINFEGSMTEAAFTGTVRVVESEIQAVFGAAHEHRESILGIDEFASLTNAMKMDHSINLDNAMLTALDSGYLIKRLALGKIQYVTQLTLWTGSQPARFDLTSGLGRRFFFIYWIPSSKEEGVIKTARREAKNVYPKLELKKEINRNISKMKSKLKRVKKVVFADKIYRILDNFKIPHFEEPLYERLAMGYAIARDQLDKKLYVDVDTILSGMFAMEKNWRDEIKTGAELTEVLKVCKDLEPISVTELKKKLADFGMTYQRATVVIDILKRAGQLYVKQEKRGGKGRPTTFIYVRD